MEAIRKAGSAFFGHGDQNSRDGKSTVRPLDKDELANQEPTADTVLKETENKDGQQEVPALVKKKRFFSIGTRGRQTSLLARFDRRSSWLSDWGSSSNLNKEETITAAPIRSQEVRLRRLQRRIFPNLEEMPGNSEWKDSILLSAAQTSTTPRNLKNGGASGGLKPVPRNRVHRVLTGHANSTGGDLDLVDSRVVRIFVSSGGDDFGYERDAFADEVPRNPRVGLPMACRAGHAGESGVL